MDARFGTDGVDVPDGNRNAVIAGLEFGLEFSGVASFLLESGTVIFSNSAAKRLLSDGPILQVESGILRTRREPEAEALASAVAELLAEANDVPNIRSLVLTSRGGQPVMLLTLQSLGRPELGKLVIVRATDLHARLEIDIDWLRSQFGLTRSEARVAASLLTDRSIAAIAKALNLGSETVRSHLKRLMGKLGVTSQAQLLGVLYAAQSAAAVKLADSDKNLPDNT